MQYILASSSLDTAGPDSPARLFTWKDGELHLEKEGTLSQINEAALEVDARIAQMVREGQIDGVMFVSAEPERVNHLTFQAAIEASSPWPAPAAAPWQRCRAWAEESSPPPAPQGPPAAQGAVAFTTAFAREWGVRYRPVIGKTGAQAAENLQTNIWKRINFRGIMMTSLPAFIAMALCLAISRIPVLSDLSGVF